MEGAAGECGAGGVGGVGGAGGRRDLSHVDNGRREGIGTVLAHGRRGSNAWVVWWAVGTRWR